MQTDRADPVVLSTGLRRALAAHSLAGHRVHQLGPALLTITLDAAHAQALGVVLAARRELPRQTPATEDELRWGEGPAATAAASLAVALAAYGPGTYARVLASGHVTAGLSPTTAHQVTDALNTRPAPLLRRGASGAAASGTAGKASTTRGIDLRYEAPGLVVVQVLMPNAAIRTR